MFLLDATGCKSLAFQKLRTRVMGSVPGWMRYLDLLIAAAAGVVMAANGPRWLALGLLIVAIGVGIVLKREHSR